MTWLASLDDVDRRIVAALQADPRASWSRLGGLVRISETTVLRRVQRLRATGVLVVVAVPDPLKCGFGQPVLLKFRTVPGEAATLAHLLAERSDVRFVALLTGRSDVICELIAPDRQYLSRVLMTELAASGAVLATYSEIILKTFKTSDQWSRGLLGAEAQVLSPQNGNGSVASDKKVKIDDIDARLLTALGNDGRRSYAELSQELGLSETSVARRVNALTSSNRLYFVAMVDSAALGFGFEVFVHLRVELAALDSVASALAAMPQVRYVSATTGDSDLAFEGIFRDTDEFYQFLTRTLSGAEGIRDVEVDVMLETLKRAFRYPLFTAEESVVNLPISQNTVSRAPRRRAKRPKQKSPNT